ncbi:MAG: type III pantothenate kinase [Planctomycetaceae bacterium]|jgi:type III pantothenate kinase|nr:type III pantothenate kinase [Planctomycetaceae bacterium]
MSEPQEIVAVDIGNSRIKFGRYSKNSIVFPGPLPQPTQVIVEQSEKLFQIELNLRETPLAEGSEWLISSVNKARLSQFCQWMKDNRSRDKIRILTRHNIRTPLEVAEPEKVGMDRLCNALASTTLTRRGEPVLIVDIGSATTLDIVSGEGHFLGGAIMPGFRASATALRMIADQLPEIDADDLRFPTFPGKNTSEAIEAGLFWGMIGAIRQFLAFAREGSSHALLLLTGGDAFPVLEALLNPCFKMPSDTIIAESPRIANPSGVSCPPVIDSKHSSLYPAEEDIPDNTFIPVAHFHEAICCPYLTLSGIAFASLS